MTRRSGPGTDPVHVPVMLREVLEHLDPRPGGFYVDATVGGGGHTAAILDRIGPNGRVLGMDRDGEALELVRHRLGADARLQLEQRDYRELKAVIEERGLPPAEGVLADLGISTIQLDGPGRGFSFTRDEPLDMRMDRSRGVTAAEWLAAQDEGSLTRVIREYGEEVRHARTIARALLQRRDKVRTTGELADVVRGALPSRGPTRIHPATRTFQAIRIAVNDELDGLDEFVEDAVEALRPDGRLVVISFHSLEDRFIKRSLRRLQGECTCPPDLPVCSCGRLRRVQVLTSRPLRPQPDEVEANPRARSARLRAARRTSEEEQAA